MYLLLNFLYEYSIFKKDRKIIISEDQILIKIPQAPLFQIKWEDFNELNIKRKEKSFRIRKYPGFKLKFIGKKRSKSIELSEYLHFKPSKLEEIVKILRNNAKQRGKKVKMIFRT